MDRLEFWAELAGYPLRLTCAHPYSAELFRDYRVVPTAEREAAYRALTAGMAAPGAPLGLTGAELAGLTEGEEGFPPGYLESLELYYNPL